MFVGVKVSFIFLYPLFWCQSSLPSPQLYERFAKLLQADNQCAVYSFFCVLGLYCHSPLIWYFCCRDLKTPAPRLQLQYRVWGLLSTPGRGNKRFQRYGTHKPLNMWDINLQQLIFQIFFKCCGFFKGLIYSILISQSCQTKDIWLKNLVNKNFLFSFAFKFFCFLFCKC